MRDSIAARKMTPENSAAERGQQTLAAIVLTDAVSFSARMSVDEERTLSLIQHDLKVIQGLCQQFEGQVVKSTGDGLLMYFVSAVQAVNCSLAIQRGLAEIHQEKQTDNPLQHRIGVHLGDVFFKDADIMGNGVNIAARLQTEAYPRGICISQIVYDVVKARLNLNVTYAGPLQLKNIQEPQPAYHLHPFAAPAMAAAPVVEPAGEPEPLSPPAGTAATTAEEPANPRDRLEPGSKVGGRYKVQRVLGQGGFGRSYLVEDTQRFGELCVLKEFFPTNTSSGNLQKALDLFKREAKTLYQIHHRQIPTFHACFTQSKRLFIVQEYINGVTYAQLLKQRKREGRCFAPEEVLQWLIHMLQVLDYLHDLSVVHRDISPDNIIYSSDRGLPVLIDFGLVNDAMSDILSGQGNDDEEAGHKGKSAATIVGKFGYSPPEQLRLGQCFPSSDLYALGVTAIVLLTGKYPRELIHQDSMEWDWQRHIRISPTFAQLLTKMTRQRPNERYQSAGEVLEIAVKLADHANSPLTYATTPAIDLTVDPAAAPLFDLPLQRGQLVAPDPDFLNQCREELTRSIGPMASILLEDVLEQNPQASPEELVSLLAAQLSNGQQADEFTSRIFAKSAILVPGDRTGSLSMLPPQGQTPTSAARENTEFLNRCREALAQSIGPMASFLLDEVLEDNPQVTPQELVFQLANEIPDMKKAREFQQRLL